MHGEESTSQKQSGEVKMSRIFLLGKENTCGLEGKTGAAFK